MTRADLERRLLDLKTRRDELNSDADHWNRAHPNEAPIEGSGQQLDDMIDNFEASLNNGRNPA